MGVLLHCIVLIVPCRAEHCIKLLCWIFWFQSSAVVVLLKVYETLLFKPELECFIRFILEY